MRIYVRKRWPAVADLGSRYSLHHGMCEWLEVCSSCSAVVAGTEPSAATANPQLVPPGMRSEIVAILAGMFFDKQGEATR